jgi:hypothetical protein
MVGWDGGMRSKDTERRLGSNSLFWPCCCLLAHFGMLSLVVNGAREGRWLARASKELDYASYGIELRL